MQYVEKDGYNDECYTSLSPLSLLSLSPLSPITSLTLWLEDLAGAHVDAVYALYALRLYIRWTVASSPVAL